MLIYELDSKIHECEEKIKYNKSLLLLNQQDTSYNNSLHRMTCDLMIELKELRGQWVQRQDEISQIVSKHLIQEYNAN